jgi:hypothetical protein
LSTTAEDQRQEKLFFETLFPIGNPKQASGMVAGRALEAMLNSTRAALSALDEAEALDEDLGNKFF